MQLITDKIKLPSLLQTPAATLYKGHLPVIIFTTEEHREYETARAGWAGWATARETARTYFETHVECGRIEMLFMNEPGAGAEASYGGAYAREEFATGGKYGARL